MATYIDLDEGRDRRLKMLLDTANNAMQIQNQRQELGLKQKALTYDRARLGQDVLKNRLEMRQMEAGQRNMDRLLGGGLNGQNGSMGITGASVDPFTGKTSLSIGETPQAKVAREVQQETSKNLTAFVDAVPKAAMALTSIEEASKELGDFKRGFIPQLFAKGDIIAKEFGQDEKVSNYVGIVGQNLSILSRTIAEEKGPLTDRDIARIEKGLGQKTAPLKTKLALLNELRGKMVESLTVKLQAAKTPYSEFVKGNPRLAQMLNIGKVQEDKVTGDRAIVYPDGSFQEI